MRVPVIYDQAMIRSAYDKLFDTRGSAAEDLPEPARSDLPGNAMRLVAAGSLQNSGDQIVNGSTVLPWLLTSIGAPAWTIGLLLPVREAGSMLPQAALTPWVRRARRRKWVWVAGGAVQAVATAAMAFTAAVADDATAGVTILIELALFSLGRALSSIASKDVQGRTIPKGQRGQINGISALASGIVAVTIGVGIRLLGGEQTDTVILAVLLAASSLVWIAAMAVYASVSEPAGDVDDHDDSEGWVTRSWNLLRDDAPFRKFVTVRALLLVSSLSPPFIVVLASQNGNAGLKGLGPFLIASGLAGILGGRVSGRLADRSSRKVMIWSAGISSLVILAVVAGAEVESIAKSAWLFPVSYFVLALTHLTVRVARKTYVVDMAEGDKRTDYVAVGNTAMGVILLATGAISGALAQAGPNWALVFLAALGLLGVLVGRTLPEVSRGSV